MVKAKQFLTAFMLKATRRKRGDLLKGLIVLIKRIDRLENGDLKITCWRFVSNSI